MKTNKRKAPLIVVAIILVALLTIVGLNITNLIKNMNLGLDLQGGFEIAYEVSPLEEGSDLPEMSAVVTSIQKRINVLGVNEPEINVEGSNQIRVQLAGVSDQDQARKIISSTANLTFRNSSDELLMDASVLTEGGASLGYQDGKPVVSLKIKDTNKFYEVTSEVAKTSDRLMVVWLDFEEGVDSYEEEAKKAQLGQETAYISAATVSGGISGDAIISGSFTDSEARTLANLINSGSLPVKLTEIYSNVVSAELGTSAYSKTMIAGGIGIILVMLFMIIKYRLPGFISALTLPIYIFVVLGIYKLMGGVFTLPGIAALILGVGMTVDSNVITFERLKEELYLGRSVKTAIENSQKMSLSAIIDAQITTFIAALIMYIFGTGSVKGFATMLMITLITTAFVSIILMRLLMLNIGKSEVFEGKYGLFAVKPSLVPDMSKGEKEKYVNPISKFDFIKNSKFAIIAAVAILVIAIGAFGVRSASGNGLNLGIDFSSGTKITIAANDELTSDSVTKVFGDLGYQTSRVQITGDNNNGAYVFINEALPTDKLTELKANLLSHYGHEASDSVVTPTVGKTLVKNAFILTILAWICMLVYVSIRFKWDCAVGCIVALIHDVLMVFGFFVICNFEINSDLIAVFLAIIGYSINNSIVVFDRIREELNGRTNNINKAQLVELTNNSLTHTFGRSLSSSITTLLPVVALLVLGSASIFTFTFALAVGIVCGTVSSMFIAPYTWESIRANYKPKQRKKKERKHEEVEEFVIPGINDIK